MCRICIISPVYCAFGSRYLRQKPISATVSNPLPHNAIIELMKALGHDKNYSRLYMEKKLFRLVILLLHMPEKLTIKL